MKRFALYFGIAILSVASCSTREMDIKAPIQDDVIFYASFEQPGVVDTKVYANEDLLLRWTADDRVSIFGNNTYNQQYKFLGETGDNSGGFSKVDGAEYVTGNAIPHKVSVYPYQEGTKISEDEVLTLTLPAEQHYAENAFGLGANTMVSVSEDNFLQYKNVGGFLMLKLYGKGVSVSSITLKGNNGEKLAGKASVIMPLDGVPSVTMSSDANTAIALTCTTPVSLGATEDESSLFWFVMPPITFKKGFTISVIDPSGETFEKSTANIITVERSKLIKMSPIEVSLVSNIVFADPETKSICIRNWDTNQDGELSYWEAQRVQDIGQVFEQSNIRSFNEFKHFSSVTEIPSAAFCGSKIKEISFPESVIKVGHEAFAYCASLSFVSFNNNLCEIEEYAFSGCSSLSDVAFPSSLHSIGRMAFQATPIKRMVIPDSLTEITGNPFSRCTLLESIEGKYSSPDKRCLVKDGTLLSFAPKGIRSFTFSDDIYEVGEYAFYGLTSLESVSFTNATRIFGESAFQGCTSLKTVEFGNQGESLTMLGIRLFQQCSALVNADFSKATELYELPQRLFYGCGSLMTCTIPGSVEIINPQAFLFCGALTVYCLPIVPPVLNSVTSGQADVFEGTTGIIYVPFESVLSYKEAFTWQQYADRIQAIPSPSNPSPEAIDLGLSVKWASFNLGATAPEEYGDYYAWGETEPKSTYTWENYIFTASGDSWDNVTFNKYNVQSNLGVVDNKTILDLEDDAASVNWMGGWRLPTYDEWNELRHNCSWEWITNYNGTGVNGYLVTSNITNYSDHFIFLSAAGLREDEDLRADGETVFYWSSSLWTEYSTAAWGGSLNFVGNQEYDLVGENFSSDRHLGFPIRPVYAE
ncbi:MAG: leucine-rich repeat protein [Bacteroidales bacterium]|nr:leucine-rich repeat protein [Bacteroidales bacterium]